MIGGARTMTAAVGHGKKAARHIDAWLRGSEYVKPPPHPPIPYEQMNLTVFLDAARREQAELPVAKRSGFEEIVSGLSEREARYEATRCLSCGNCFECDNCFAACPGAGDRQAGQGPLLPRGPRSLHRLRRVLRAMPVSCHRDDAGARGRRWPPLRMPSACPPRFTVRAY